MAPADEYEDERKNMVKHQLISRGIHHPGVLQAMQQVPRHRFVPSYLQSHAYADSALPIGEGQTISQPYIVALMTQSSHPDSMGKALEIGTGSGYGAAVLAQVYGHIVTIERLPHLAEAAKELLAELHYSNITCLDGDGSLGAPDFAPYQGILVTAGAPAVPDTLKEQLAVGGYLVIPVGDATTQKLLCIQRLSASAFTEETVEFVRFVLLIGKQGWH